MRAIELYHVKGNGWNDIGYNSLVDRFGQVFEGRAGGIDRNVVGAHAKGFNTGSFGIAVMGNYRTAAPAGRRATRSSSRSPGGSTSRTSTRSHVHWISGGNRSSGPGKPVLLRAVSGHRDTGFTTCPGERLYDQMPTIAHRVAATGLPKLYAPAVDGRSGGTSLHGAGSPRPAPGRSRCRRERREVAPRRGHGRGRRRGPGTRPAPPLRRYAWTIEAGPDDAAGGGHVRLGAPPLAPRRSPVPVLSALTVAPPVISPDGDGLADARRRSRTRSARARR